MQKKIFYNLIFLFLSTICLADQNISGIPKVIDGDTVHIEKFKISLSFFGYSKKYKIRLNGIDAPEKNQKCNKQNIEYACGLKSTQALRDKIDNRAIKCKLESNKDRYQRYIGTCFLKEENLNKWMVRNGHAIAYRRYLKDYIDDEEYAKKNKLGIWQGYFLEPEKWRKLN